MRHFLILIFFVFSFSLHSQISVFADFENGNVEYISSDTIKNSLTFKPSLETDLNTTRCWFYFGITGHDTSRVLTIDYQYVSSVIAPENPVYSYNQKDWYRLEAYYGTGRTKQVKFKFENDTIYFATGYPYNYTDVLNFVDSIAENQYIDTSTLVISEGGRRVPMFVIQDKNEKPEDLVWIIGRQHAFETTMNYTLEGMVKFWISDDDKAVEMRENTLIYVVPMMDVDNVFIGASGRMQKPVDFNRDWSKNPHWKAVRKTQELIKETSQKYNYRVFLDVHSTYPGTTKPRFGLFNEYENDEKEYRNLRKFFRLYNKNAGYNLDEIEGNMKEKYSDAYSNRMIDSTIFVTDFVSTVECDWTFNHNNEPLTRKELRKVGKLIAESLCDYLN